MDPGFVFSAADHELTDDYLAGEIAGRPIASKFINHADVYSAVPEDLVSGLRCVRDRDGNDACYIISSVRYAGKKKNRKLRTIDGDPAKSYWHSEKGKMPLERSEAGGYVQDLVQAIKGAGGRHERTGWRMKEYGLSTAAHGDSAIVLCKVYRTPRDHSEKRKAADGDYAEEDSRPSARPRLAAEHPPVALRPEPERSTVGELFRTHFQVPYAERIRAAMPRPMEDLECYFAGKALQEINASSLQEMEAQPEPQRDDSFVQSMEQEFPSLFPSHSNEAVIEEAAPPWAAAAQPEDAATGLVETIAAHVQMDAISLEEEGAQAQPEPEWDMQQEFPFLYRNHNDDDAVTEEATQPGTPEAQPEEEAAQPGPPEAQAEEEAAQPGPPEAQAEEEAAQPGPPETQPEEEAAQPGPPETQPEEEAAQPGPPETQPEDGAATGLVDTIAADDQMDAGLGEEGGTGNQTLTSRHRTRSSMACLVQRSRQR